MTSNGLKRRQRSSNRVGGAIQPLLLDCANDDTSFIGEICKINPTELGLIRIGEKDQWF